MRKEQLHKDALDTERKIKHFSSVQNKAIYMPDIDRFRNKTLKRIETPSFWHFEWRRAEQSTYPPGKGKRTSNAIIPNHIVSQVEKEFQEKIKTDVVFLELKPRPSETFG